MSCKIVWDRRISNYEVFGSNIKSVLIKICTRNLFHVSFCFSQSIFNRSLLHVKVLINSGFSRKMMANTLRYGCGSEKTDEVQLGGSSSNGPSWPRIQQQHRDACHLVDETIQTRLGGPLQNLMEVASPTRNELMLTRRLWDAGSVIYQLRYISTPVFIGNSHGSI